MDGWIVEFQVIPRTTTYVRRCSIDKEERWIIHSTDAVEGFGGFILQSFSGDNNKAPEPQKEVLMTNV
jgi:hypothetical protein